MVRMLSFEKIEITEEFFVERINLANDFRKQMGLSDIIALYLVRLMGYQV